MSAEHNGRTDRLARTLGWASLGLGVVQLTAPRAVSRAAGIDDSVRARTAVPAAGARELVHAAGLLGSRRPAPWVWTRVAGDALDLAVLAGAGTGRSRRRRQRVTTATAVVAGITAIDLFTAFRSHRRRAPERGEDALHTHAAITVNRPREEVYRYWHSFENLPRFMTHLESVRITGDRRSRWVAKAPLAKKVKWDAEIVQDRPGELIAWRSLEGAGVGNSGSVRFTDASGGRGTEVRVDMGYAPPGGKAGAAFAKLLGEHPDQQVRDDLRRFKQLLETGEVVRSEGSPEGTRAWRQARQRPARPVR